MLAVAIHHLTPVLRPAITCLDSPCSELNNAESCGSAVCIRTVNADLRFEPSIVTGLRSIHYYLSRGRQAIGEAQLFSISIHRGAGLRCHIETSETSLPFRTDNLRPVALGCGISTWETARPNILSNSSSRLPDRRVLEIRTIDMLRRSHHMPQPNASMCMSTARGKDVEADPT